MQTGTIQITTLVTCVLWCVGVAFLLISFWQGYPYGAVAVFFAVTASTVQIRALVCTLQHREREAYELGRESVRHIH